MGGTKILFWLTQYFVLADIDEHEMITKNPSFSASAIFQYCFFTSIRHHLHRRLTKVPMHIHPFVKDRLHHALLKTVHHRHFLKDHFNHRD